MAGAWTPLEQHAVCNLYHEIWKVSMDSPGAKCKAAMIRLAQGAPKPTDNGDWGPISCAGMLKARSRGSIELKLMNVTAALEALGGAFEEFSLAEDGYRPLPNMQKSLKLAVADYFDPAQTQPREGIE